jgi:hypothetical protein
LVFGFNVCARRWANPKQRPAMRMGRTDVRGWPLPKNNPHKQSEY